MSISASAVCELRLSCDKGGCQRTSTIYGTFLTTALKVARRKGWFISRDREVAVCPKCRHAQVRKEARTLHPDVAKSGATA